MRGVVVLDTAAPDRLPAAVASVRTDGTLHIDGHTAQAQTLIVNIAGSAIGLEAKSSPARARPRRLPDSHRRPRPLTTRGLAPDRWVGTGCGSEPGRSAAHAGRYELTLALPKDKLPRKVEPHSPASRSASSPSSPAR